MNIELAQIVSVSFGVLLLMTLVHGLSREHVNHDALDNEHMLDKNHIASHYEGEAKIDTEHMTEAESQWHSFVQHDLNNDTLLDGIEIMKAIMHSYGEDAELLNIKKPDLSGKSPVEADQLMEEFRTKKIKFYEDIVDSSLADRDLNKDGYISFPELIHVQNTYEQDSDNKS